jgi:hypothetical protein
MMTLLHTPTRAELDQRAAALKQKLPAWVLSLELREAFTGFPAVDALVIVKDGHQGIQTYRQVSDLFYEELIHKDGLDAGHWQVTSQSSWREAMERRAQSEARMSQEEDEGGSHD